MFLLPNNNVQIVRIKLKHKKWVQFAKKELDNAVPKRLIFFFCNEKKVSDTPVLEIHNPKRGTNRIDRANTESQ